MLLTKMDGYQKLCDTNKNVTKMAVIIKGGLLYQTQIMQIERIPIPAPDQTRPDQTDRHILHILTCKK